MMVWGQRFFLSLGHWARSARPMCAQWGFGLCNLALGVTGAKPPEWKSNIKRHHNYKINEYIILLESCSGLPYSKYISYKFTFYSIPHQTTQTLEFPIVSEGMYRSPAYRIYRSIVLYGSEKKNTWNRFSFLKACCKLLRWPRIHIVVLRKGE